MNQKIKALCDENIKTRADFRKWALRHHPDKLNTASSAPMRKFQTISGYATDLLKTSEDRIPCPKTASPKPRTPSPKPPTPKPNTARPTSAAPSPVTERPSKKKADCLRTKENWAKIMRHHRFDKPAFNPGQFNYDMATASPKMIELIANIKNLDAQDMRREGKRFKHFIFSDVKQGGYGAKIIASALVANGFNHCFTNSLKVKVPTQNERQETFGMMSSTAVYEKPFTQKVVKEVQKMYNDRPSNVHGEKIRFIVLDSGFKEGIDLLDVKYVHIFENQRNAADLTQAVGRATRSCGQMGLNFVPNVGWKLHVYQYSLLNDKGTAPLFNDFLHHAGINMNDLKMTESLERVAVLSAVDYDLNRNVNQYESRVDDEVLELAYPGMYGGRRATVGCSRSDKCGTRSTKTVPFTIKDMIAAYDGKLPTGFSKMLTKDKRVFFCTKLRTSKRFCDKLNRMYFGKDSPNNKLVLAHHTKSAASPATPESTIPTMREYFLDMKQDVEDMEDLPFDEFMRRINKMYAEYKYKPIVIENGCAKKPDNDGDVDDAIVKFSESQAFVTQYFTPAHFAKGLLVWHSVGTGKTCTAISVKSFLFERLDYSILWVTRTTLKEDIWKNMYDKICDHVIREKYTKGDDRAKLRKHMSKKFLPPMSYKQFSNTLEGKNDTYQKLVALNGKDDLLKNTLVVVDEAHKLYSSGDMLAAEKPNMAVIERALRASKSCKVMLMTGTPVTEDPMNFVRLLNLTIKGDPFPTKADEFKREYMQNNDFTKSGERRFKEKAKGLISYLNKRYDPRQFAQPVFYEKVSSMVPFDPEATYEECYAPARAARYACARPPPSEDELDELLKNKELLHNEIKELSESVKRNMTDAGLKAELKSKREMMKALNARIRIVKRTNTQQRKAWTTEQKECDKVQRAAIRVCKKRVETSKDMAQITAIKKC